MSTSDVMPIASAFGLEAPQIQPITQGLIHQTYKLQTEDGRAYALQRVSPIFSPRVHEDIEAVTRHLTAKHIPTPVLVPTREGALFHQHKDEIWRVLTWIDGVSFNALESPQIARSAGRLLARFHNGLADLAHEFVARRLGVHDTDKHLDGLDSALKSHAGHRLFQEVAPLAAEILARARSSARFDDIAPRVVHGDPKINNMLFEKGSHAPVALIDLDTVAPMPVPVELGDAMRSWCNPKGEDADSVTFSIELFSAAVAGYAEGGGDFLSPAEVDAIVPATETITLELAARFLRDALVEDYFGWDHTRFETRGDHNLLRAKAQLSLAIDLSTKRKAAEAAIHEAF